MKTQNLTSLHNHGSTKVKDGGRRVKGEVQTFEGSEKPDSRAFTIKGILQTNIHGQIRLIFMLLEHFRTTHKITSEKGVLEFGICKVGQELRQDWPYFLEIR